MDSKDILVCITNHNSNDNALKLKEQFLEFYDTIIIDSKSNEIRPEFDVLLENVYYTGLYNQSVLECRKMGKKYVYFIASDVYIEDVNKIHKLISGLNKDIYLWAPSSSGQSHLHCKNSKSDGLRDVPYLEGFTFLVHIDVCNYLGLIENNKYGYGIDLMLGYVTIKDFKKRCVVDDRVEVYHKEGTGYDSNQALHDMYNWMCSIQNASVYNYTVLYSKSPGHEQLLNYLQS